ncbi:MAG TPA: glycerol-3-phosphate dehydrogenase, partial [Planctomycetota bacterium]|nr:glycerol-3-phosphate dehydrogenase [Planctomycetota bacterium]
MENVAVVGDGAWGTALGIVLLERGASVTQWSWSSEYAGLMQRTRSNPQFLPGVRLPAGLTVSAD